MISKLQLYISENFSPYTNLAIEKYLLDTVPNDSCVLYLWQNNNTVVIGKNQNPWSECRCSVLENENAKLARRLSGGGAVFHDLGNLNFTFLCATQNYDISKQMLVIQKACALAGINAEISGRNDILANGYKFSGNAFYNSKGKSYHHGTLLINSDKEKISRYLTPSKAKLEAKGVKSVKSRIINLTEISDTLTCDDMKKYMITAFEEVYKKKVSTISSLNFDIINKTAKIYSSREFIYGSTLPFSCTCEKRFSWGSIQLQLLVKDGIITGAKVYTDAMDHTLASAIESALTNCRFEESSIILALEKQINIEMMDDLSKLINENLF